MAGASPNGAAASGGSWEGGLAKAGLSRFIPRFASEGVTDEAFRALLVEVRGVARADVPP